MKVLETTYFEIMFVSFPSRAFYNLEVFLAGGILYKGFFSIGYESGEFYMEILTLEVRRPAIGIGSKFGEEHLGLFGFA